MISIRYYIFYINQ